jgi:hypothetical protein
LRPNLALNLKKKRRGPSKHAHHDNTSRESNETVNTSSIISEKEWSGIQCEKSNYHYSTNYKHPQNIKPDHKTAFRKIPACFAEK